MGKSPESKTSPTLLARLRNAEDQSAWEEFVLRYGPKIFGWCRKKLQDADAEDVTQKVLIKIVRQMRTFQYDPKRSFGAYLRTVVKRALADYAKTQKVGTNGTGGSEIRAYLNSIEAEKDLLDRLADTFDLEVFEEAKVRVQLQVEPATWEAFHLQVFEGVPAEEVARIVNKRIDMVYIVKKRVLERLKKEIQRLNEPDPDQEE